MAFDFQIGSFRTRAVILAVIIALAPLAFVYLGPLYDRVLMQRMQGSLWESAEQVVTYLAESDSGLDEATQKKLEELADDNQLWIRVTDRHGEVTYEVNNALEGQRYKSMIESMLGDAPEGSHLQQYEMQRPRLTERREFRRAKERGRATRCEFAQEGRLLTCLEVRRIPPQANAPPRYAFLQSASLRAVRELAGAQYPLFTLVIQVLGAGIVIALAVGWWTVLPVKNLREQVVGRANPPVSTDPVDVEAGGEVAELQEAFNGLLEALEERRQATKSYMADIAHEVKNPVAAIKTAAERLDTDQLDEDRVDRIARVLQDSSDRLDQLVTRFLDLARAEAGLSEEAREPVALDELVANLVEKFRADERFRDVDFTCDTRSATVQASPAHLETAVRNLLENGASFAETAVDVTLETRDGEAILTVHDDGPGIDPDDLPHVFDRFFSRRPGNEGTGLGLAMTRAVTEAHDGSIDVDSEPGQGTRFTLRFPNSELRSIATDSG